MSPAESVQPLEVEIYSLPFRLRAPADEHDRLTRAARRVDQIMRDQVAAQPSAETTRLAIQAAFVIAGEYFKALDEGFGAPGDASAPSASAVAGGVTSRVDALLQALDESMAALDAAVPTDSDIEARWASIQANAAPGSTASDPAPGQGVDPSEWPPNYAPADASDDWQAQFPASSPSSQ